MNLSKINMYHYYSHIYNNYSIIPRIPYPLAASSLTNNHFNKLHVALYSAIIASKGFNRHFPIPLRYGLHKYSGLGILDLEVQQGIRKKSNTSQFNLPSQTPNFNTRNNWLVSDLTRTKKKIASKPKITAHLRIKCLATEPNPIHCQK